MQADERRISRWYFGGVASSMPLLITHPLDLIKVVIQTQKDKLSIAETTGSILKDQGFLTFYNGLSASILRQYTYTLTRFGVYTMGANMIDTESMYSKVKLAAIGGAIGGFVGSPADLINVRLQNDVKLQKEQRRNYKHAFDGLTRVCREEGWMCMFNGATLTALRGAFMTVGQIAFYEQTKDFLLANGFAPSLSTYILASTVSALTATALTQPIDVIKTRRQNARPGEYSSILDVIVKTALEGPHALYKGSIPAFTRLGPHTVLLFVTLEFLRTHFGYLPVQKDS